MAEDALTLAFRSYQGQVSSGGGGGGSANTNPLPSGPGSPFSPLDVGLENKILQMPASSGPLSFDINDIGEAAGNVTGLAGLLKGGFNIQTGSTLSELGSVNNLTGANVGIETGVGK